MQSIRTLLFDLDDTLFDAESGYREGVERVVDFLLDETQVEASRPVLLEAYQRARQLTKSRMVLKSPSSHNRVIYFKVLLEEVFGRCDFSLHAKVMEVYESALLKRAFLEDRSAIERLASRYRIAIVTNENTALQLKKLKALDPCGTLFPTVVTSEEAGVEKPDPRIFELALNRCEAEARSTAMIGDSWERDVQGAIELGIRSWWVCENGTPAKESSLLLGHGSLESALTWFWENRNE